MADSGYVVSLLGGLGADVKRVFSTLFEYLLRDLAWGQVEDKERAGNFRGYYYTATTAAVASEEFTIAHGLGVTPYVLVPVLPLDVEGAQTVRLEVSRVADAQRVYLTSPDTSAVIYVMIEG